jgi:circadian clock protein KaiC
MTTKDDRISTGVDGLDEILHGGLPRNHIYLLQGRPGSGKTTLAMQFLIEGVRRGDKTLYITLLQARRELEATAASHGWDISGIEIASLVEAAEAESRLAEQTLLPSSEIQLDDVMNAVGEAIERAKPDRLVFDSIDQLRLLANDPMLYRRKVLAIQRMLEKRQTTAIFTEPGVENEEFKTLAHGAIMLDMVIPPYGEMRRRLTVEKMRGVDFAGGLHACRLRTGGLEVYPRLPLARRREVRKEWRSASSHIPALDKLLGGGLEYGTAALLVGQTGTGKSSVAAAHACAVASRGQHAVILLFDERTDTLVRRSEGIGMNVKGFMEQGLIKVHELNVGDISAGEMAHLLRREVEQLGATLVVLDSLTGYYAALPGEPHLTAQLHEMLAYLGQHDVLSLILVTEHGLTGTGASVDASYIADTVVMLRRFEANGSIHIAVSVPKKRHGNHEKTIRELKITSDGLVVGEPLTGFQGILTGEPSFVGEHKRLME